MADTFCKHWRCTLINFNEIRWKHSDSAGQLATPPALFNFAQKFNDVTNGQTQFVIIVLCVAVNGLTSTILCLRFVSVKYLKKKKLKFLLRKQRSCANFDGFTSEQPDSCRPIRGHVQNYPETCRFCQLLLMYLPTSRLIVS